MSLAFVSSMNINLFNQYGERFIKEFSDNASSDLRLYIIFEGDPPKMNKISENIIFLKLNSPSHDLFIKYFGGMLNAQGFKTKFFIENNEQKINIVPDYRFNAIKFSYKPFSIFQSINHISSRLDFLVWIDADLRCKKFFNEDALVKFLPQRNQLMSYLGRLYSYSECGFLGFNLSHPHFLAYIKRVIEIYSTGEIFSLDEWHDSYIWDLVRKEFEKKEIKFKNISGEKAYKSGHPFIKSGLEEFFDHLKGPIRKKVGHS